MDKTTNDKEKVKKEESTENPDMLLLSVDAEQEEAVKDTLESIEDSRIRVITAIKKRYNSFRSDKRTLNHIMSLVNTSHEIARWSVISAYAIDFHTKRLDILEKVVIVLIKKLDIDLPNVKSEIEKLKTTVDSQAIKTVNEFVQNMKKNIEEYKKRMEENDLAA